MTPEVRQHLETSILGLSSGRIPLTYKSEFAEAVLQICLQAQHDIRIYTHDLDQALYGQNDLLEALKRMALARRNLCVRILLEDSTPARKNDHRLIPLIRRLPSRFAVRRPPAEKGNSPTSYLIADHTALVYRRHPKEYLGHADFNHRREADELNRTFMEIWEQAETERELRILGI